MGMSDVRRTERDRKVLVSCTALSDPKLACSLESCPVRGFYSASAGGSWPQPCGEVSKCCSHSVFQTEIAFEIGQATRPISTGQLRALPRFHFQPINLVVYKGSLEVLRPGTPGLEAGFPLRCFQRLSVPDMATRLCSWQNNRHTRGLSIQVLSYYG